MYITYISYLCPCNKLCKTHQNLVRANEFTAVMHVCVMCAHCTCATTLCASPSSPHYLRTPDPVGASFKLVNFGLFSKATLSPKPSSSEASTWTLTSRRPLTSCSWSGSLETCQWRYKQQHGLFSNPLSIPTLNNTVNNQSTQNPQKRLHVTWCKFNFLVLGVTSPH